MGHHPLIRIYIRLLFQQAHSQSRIPDVHTVHYVFNLLFIYLFSGYILGMLLKSFVKREGRHTLSL